MDSDPEIATEPPSSLETVLDDLQNMAETIEETTTEAELETKKSQDKEDTSPAHEEYLHLEERYSKISGSSVTAFRGFLTEGVDDSDADNSQEKNPSERKEPKAEAQPQDKTNGKEEDQKDNEIRRVVFHETDEGVDSIPDQRGEKIDSEKMERIEKLQKKLNEQGEKESVVEVETKKPTQISFTEQEVVANHPFLTEEENELPFERGDKIMLIRELNGWGKGRIGSTTGWFPLLFTSPLDPDTSMEKIVRNLHSGHSEPKKANAIAAISRRSQRYKEDFVKGFTALFASAQEKEEGKVTEEKTESEKTGESKQEEKQSSGSDASKKEEKKSDTPAEEGVEEEADKETEKEAKKEIKKEAEKDAEKETENEAEKEAKTKSPPPEDKEEEATEIKPKETPETSTDVPVEEVGKKDNDGKKKGKKEKKQIWSKCRSCQAVVTVGGAAMKEGFLTKKGKIRKSWMSRWFIIQPSDSHVLYYENLQAIGKLHAKGVIHLTKESTLKEESESDAGFLFTLNTRDRTFYLVSRDKQQGQEWIVAFEEKIKSLSDSGSE